jgi:hypothetical protein
MKHALAFFLLLFFLISPSVLQAQEPLEACSLLCEKPSFRMPRFIVLISFPFHVLQCAGRAWRSLFLFAFVTSISLVINM